MLFIISKQTSIDQFVYLDRIGMENDSQGNMDFERELELRRIQVR